MLVLHWSRNGGIVFMRPAGRDGSPCLLALMRSLCPLPHCICAPPPPTTLLWRSVPLKFYFSEQIIVPVGPGLYVTLYLVTFIVRAAFSPPHLLLQRRLLS